MRNTQRLRSITRPTRTRTIGNAQIRNLSVSVPAIHPSAVTASRSAACTCRTRKYSTLSRHFHSTSESIGP